MAALDLAGTEIINSEVWLIDTDDLFKLDLALLDMRSDEMTSKITTGKNKKYLATKLD